MTRLAAEAGLKYPGGCRTAPLRQDTREQEGQQRRLAIAQRFSHVFAEDGNREQGRMGAANLALVRKLALTLPKKHPAKESLACKRLHAFDVDFLQAVISRRAILEAGMRSPWTSAQLNLLRAGNPTEIKAIVADKGYHKLTMLADYAAVNQAHEYVWMDKPGNSSRPTATTAAGCAGRGVDGRNAGAASKWNGPSPTSAKRDAAGAVGCAG